MLARLRALAAASGMDSFGPAIVISAIDGIAGVGKTALAVHFAHEVAADFLDGQLFIDLRGFDSRRAPLPPSEALVPLLHGLGVSAGSIPSDIDEQSAFYRSVLAGRRVLIHLDNAISADQARPLMPGSPG